MLRRTFLLGAAALVAGCAANGPAKSTGTLAADYAAGSVSSIVMLPVLNPSRAAVHQPTLQYELALTIQEKNKTLRFMATNEAMTRFMTSGDALHPRSFAADVFAGKTPDPKDVEAVHAVLGIDAAVVRLHGTGRRRCGHAHCDRRPAHRPHDLDRCLPRLEGAQIQPGPL